MPELFVEVRFEPLEAAQESSENVQFIRSFFEELMAQDKLFKVYTYADLVTSLAMGDMFWMKAQQPRHWARLLWRGLIAKLGERYADDSFTLAAHNTAAVVWLGAVACVTAEDVHQARAFLESRRQYGSLLATSLFDTDLQVFCKQGRWLEDSNKQTAWACWASFQCMGLKATVGESMEANRKWLQENLEVLAPKAKYFLPQCGFTDVYFADSPEQYGQVRSALINWGKEHGLMRSFTGKKRPKVAANKKFRVGIVCANWRKDHSIYKAFYRQVYAMRERFELVLVNPRPTSKFDDAHMFAKVVNIPIRAAQQQGEFGIALDEKALVAEKLDALYFLETYTGEAEALMMLRRYAPVQICGYGPLASSRSPFMDWFITGSWAEPEMVQPLHTERICQVPGLGMLSSQRESVSPMKLPDSKARLVSTANFIKYRTNYVDTLVRTAQDLGNKARVVLIPNRTYLDALWLKDQVDARSPKGLLDWHFTLKEDYMPLVAASCAVLGSWPFGGYTTIVDAFSLDVPAITFEGLGPAGRVASGVARAVGLPEWTIARSPEEFQRACVRIVREPEERQAMVRTLQANKAVLFGQEQEHYLGDAIEAILRNPDAPFLRIEG